MVGTLTLVALLGMEPVDGPRARPTPYAGPIRAEVVEDFDHGQARVSLILRTQDLMGCGELAVVEARAADKLMIVVDGIRRDGPRAAFSCLMKEPPPPAAGVSLTNEMGHRTLILKSAGRTDSFALDVTPTEIRIDPIGRPAFTQLETPGRLLRAPPHPMWVSLDYSDEAARKKFRPQAEALLRALEAAGARRTTPAPGRYATLSVAWAALDPHATPPRSYPPPAVDHYYFQYDGTFEALEAVGERWRRYDRPHYKRGAWMSTFIGSWHGRVFNSSVATSRAPAPAPAAPSNPPPPPSPKPTVKMPSPTGDCGTRPGDWCPAPSGDPCGAHKDVTSCRADARCGGMAYRGESVMACQLDARGFGENCPTVGCASLPR